MARLVVMHWFYAATRCCISGTLRVAGACSAVTMLQESIAARSAAQPLLLSLAGRLELATAQLPRPAPDGAVSAALVADGRTGAFQAVSGGVDHDEEDEALAADALADGLDPQAEDSDDEDEDADALRDASGDSESERCRDTEQEDSDLS